MLTAELLATHIRAHRVIKGLQHPNVTPKISQYVYADDLSITNALEIFKAYENASGAKINLQKCKGLWSCSYKTRSDAPMLFEWTNTYLPDKLLGLYIGYTDCTDKNLEAKIHKLRNITAAWRHRYLSLRGKINGLLTSTLWYIATNVHFLSWAAKEIFLWHNKRPLLNRDVLALPIKKGVLNIPCIYDKIQALRLNKIKRLLTHEQADWKFLTSHLLHLTNMPNGKYTLVLDNIIQHIDHHLPAFLRDLLTAWHAHANKHARTNLPITLRDVMKEPLFSNPLIFINNDTFYYPDWIKAGIIFVEDLYYSVIPGFMPTLAIHELITHDTEHSTRTLECTPHELTPSNKHFQLTGHDKYTNTMSHNKIHYNRFL